MRLPLGTAVGTRIARARMHPRFPYPRVGSSLSLLEGFDAPRVGLVPEFGSSFLLVQPRARFARGGVVGIWKLVPDKLVPDLGDFA